MAAVRDGIDMVLRAYEPYPRLVVDRCWNIVAADAGAGMLLQGVAPHLLDPPNAASGSDALAGIFTEIISYSRGFDETTDLGGVVVPLLLDGPDGLVQTFPSTVTTFGTALDLTAAELSEAFLPADEATPLRS